jgi:hypothetical protein
VCTAHRPFLSSLGNSDCARVRNTTALAKTYACHANRFTKSAAM